MSNDKLPGIVRLREIIIGGEPNHSRPEPQTSSFHFNGSREEMIEAFRQSVAETYGEDRVEEIMAQQDWYKPGSAT